MESTDADQTTKPSVPQPYRQGPVTAITVFLGFSLSFMRFWSFENPGDWDWQGILSASIVAAGIGVQLFALFRSLDLRDDQEVRYKATVRYFFLGHHDRCGWCYCGGCRSSLTVPNAPAMFQSPSRMSATVRSQDQGGSHDFSFSRSRGN
jgi:hypothetical protein